MSTTINSNSLSLNFSRRSAGKQVGANGVACSFVVSAKVSKLATVRNLLKRRGRHIIRKISGRVSGPFNCRFFFKPRSAGLGFAELEREMLTLLSQAKII